MLKPISWYKLKSRHTLQRIRPGREDNALGAWVCKLQKTNMSNESLNLATVAAERFHGLDVFEQLGVYRSCWSDTSQRIIACWRTNPIVLDLSTCLWSWLIVLGHQWGWFFRFLIFNRESLELFRFEDNSTDRTCLPLLLHYPSVHTRLDTKTGQAVKNGCAEVAT